MGDNKKVANGVVALSSATVLAIYGAGYAQTRAAADRFAQQATERRPHIPASRDAAERVALDVGASSPTEPLPAPAPSPEPETPVKAVVTLDKSPAGNLSAEATVTTSGVPKPEMAAARPAAPKADAPADAAPPTASATTASGPAGEDEPAVPEQAAAPVPTPAPAPPPAPAPAVTPPPDSAKAGYKDGTFYGWGTSRHGDIQAAVVIESGRITVARVERCLTRYSCSWITPIPPRILLKQTTTYDYVSGATESSDAFQDAVAEALSQAK